MTDYALRKLLTGGSDVVYSKKRKSKNPRKLAKQYADSWCRQYAKKRWTSCVTCGKRENLQWAHLLTAAAESTRWDEDNFAVQCASCNLRHEYDPSPMTMWFLNNNGKQAYISLAQRHHSPAHYKTDDLKAIGDRYKKLCEEMDSYRGGEVT
jgi:hypothetical protein